MRLSRWLILFLALLSAGLLTGAALTISSTANQVSVWSDVLAGDLSDTSGVELALPLSCGDQLFWVTTFPAGQPEEASTTFTSSLTRQSYPSSQIFQPLPVSIRSRDVGELFRQLAYNATPLGEERAFTYTIRDYLDAWPLQVGGTLNQEENWVEELFQSYFSLPISPEAKISITVQRDSDGDSGSISYEADVPDIESYGVTQGNSVLFVLTNTAVAPHTLLDGSHIPGGWGIYRFTLNEENTDGTLETLWSLPENSEILEFWGAEDGTTFFLLTREEEQLRLRVFDAAVKLLQTTDLLSFSSGESYMQVYKGTDFFVPILNGPRSQGYNYRFAVVSRGAEGWELAFTGDDREAYQLEHGGFSWADDAFSGLVMAFDGERLAIRDSTNSPCNPFCLSIYSVDGLEYLADYYNSVSQAGSTFTGTSSVPGVQLSWTEPQMVRFTETGS